MTISMECPHCYKPAQFPDEDGLKTVKCEKCRRPYQLPPAAEHHARLYRTAKDPECPSCGAGLAPEATHCPRCFYHLTKCRFVYPKVESQVYTLEDDYFLGSVVWSIERNTRGQWSFHEDRTFLFWTRTVKHIELLNYQTIVCHRTGNRREHEMQASRSHVQVWLDSRRHRRVLIYSGLEANFVDWVSRILVNKLGFEFHNARSIDYE